MTDKEIIKGLGHCATKVFCIGCPYDEIRGKDSCHVMVMKDALDLIDRLQSEREALINGQITLQKMYAEAIKEFAEEFEKRCIASGIYPAVTKNILKNLLKELTEEKDNA